MMNGRVLSTKKHDALGQKERRTLLKDNNFSDIESFEKTARAMKAGTDDALDACAAAWSARRHNLGLSGCFPADAKGPGYHMRIWY
jgi:predicted RNase H-like nuclease